MRQFNQVKSPKIIIYDDENLEYFVGNCGTLQTKANSIDYCTLTEPTTKSLILDYTFSCSMRNVEKLETIKLDETLMKRIAKYNKEVEIKQLDKIIEEKQKKIQEIDYILQDRNKRLERLKEYICNIYNIDVSDSEYKYEEFDDEDE